ncbi:sushi, von Willebrand factor type A, EGF and pentraxin domain-containing protein 1-like [Ptychodera flava]|uniref:sushi, von Willebrand factor type A, EGF and pentraxin domain-containing protein 1-like n=1 Tax=Ptychodera flava TaxID=63121 RepID=UPI00396A4C76
MKIVVNMFIRRIPYAITATLLIISAFCTGQASTQNQDPSSDRQRELNEESNRILGKLEPYQTLQTDVVFLVDASGSIGAPNFHFEIDFIREMTAIFSISEDEMRVAVVTYSNYNTIIRHIDYIGNPNGKNKCSLLNELDLIPYTGGWTDTRGALFEAERVLQQARPTAQRLIILLTDGASNQGDPRPVAQSLRGNGIEIIAIGVGNINEAELNDIATTANVFTMDLLSDFKKLAQRIRNDVRETTWDLSVSISACNTLCTEGHNCCDDLATCSCGTRSGALQCACQPGYTGNGLQGQCAACQRGTYKEKYGYLDCTPCPEHSSTLDTASTSFSQCHCDVGYDGAAGGQCTVVRCPTPARSPGVLVTRCNNTYNMKCNFKCDRSRYRPTPGGSPERTCLADGQWSGNPFTCTKITCNALSSPAHGNKLCDSTDNDLGTTCTFTCDMGYDLVGSSDSKCEMKNRAEGWTNAVPICRVKFCPSLGRQKLFIIRPPSCETMGMRYQSVCVYECNAGYVLRGEDTKECLATGQWSGTQSDRWCKDIDPPKFHDCPADVVVSTDLLRSTARVSWKPPTATDNTGVQPTISVQPQHTKPPYWFRLGETEVTYTAKDDVNLTSTCSFVVTVIDDEPPRVIFCPFDIEITSSSRRTRVTWEEPVFFDNSGGVTVHGNRQSGSRFYWGPPAHVSFKAWDQSNNIAYCNFTVTIKQHTCPYESPPENGALSCETWLGGQFCTVSCNRRYDFVFQPEAIYYCRQNRRTQTGEWRPAPGPRGFTPFEFPWPDCARLTRPTRFRIGLEFQYYVDSCSEDSAKEQIKRQFITKLNGTYGHVAGFCGKGCEIDNVQVHCGNTHRTESGRQVAKRDVRESRSTISVTTTVSVETQNDDEHESSVTNTEGSDPTSSWPSQDEIERIISEIQESVANDSYGDIVINKTDVNMTAEFVPDTENQTQCEVGQISRNGACLICPDGSYHDIDRNKCQACAKGWYQDIEASTSCKRCPAEMSTKRTRSSSLSDCINLCRPGTYSQTGLATCNSCPIGTYQDNYGSTACVACEDGLTTWTWGAVSADFCRAECTAGTYSDTGYTPCVSCSRGSYQPMPRSTDCIQCNAGLTTFEEGAADVQYCLAVDPCDLFPCLNNATCNRVVAERWCHCIPGFGDKDCGTNIDDCAEGLCKNNGTCIDGVNDFDCLCPRGYTGINCQIEIDECQSYPCLNGGTCHDRVDNYVCECRSSFTGQHCEIKHFDCFSSPCQNGGTCFDLAENFSCCCPPGYAGHLCEQDIDECQSSPCQNGGLCFSGVNSYSCQCMPGFTGAMCGVNINECEVNLCRNGSTCIDLANAYSCTCAIGYTGTYCEVEVTNDFNLHFQSAQATDYAMLDNIPDLYDVTVSFWMSTDDTSSYGTPFSYAHAHGPDGSVVDNALTLQDYNSFALFINGGPTYTDFKANRDTNWHHVAVTWESSSGSWKFLFDNRVIHSGTGLQQGQLISGGGVLVIGQEQDGVGSLFNAAESYVGQLTQVNLWDFAMTTDEVNSLYAGCNNMGNIVAWLRVKSSVHGNVVVEESSALCSTRNDCAGDPCRNGGVCKDLVDDYECICSDGYEGKQCQNFEGVCPLALCQNGGSCHRGSGTPSCVCRSGFSGPYCENATTQCSSNPCQNGGLCELQHGRSKCVCAIGFTGRTCQYDIDECRRNNGGCSHLCHNTDGSFDCGCPSGYVLLANSKECHELSYCSYKDEMYSAEEVWDDGCFECRCQNGSAVCYDKQCPQMSCQEGHRLYLAPGECCSSCIPDPEFCRLSLNGTLYTFDGNVLQFKGQCRYVLTQDCHNGEFSVYIQRDWKRIGQSYSAHRVAAFIHIGCVTVEIQYNGEVKVSGIAVDLPYPQYSPDVVEVTKPRQNALLVKTAPGVTIEWDMLGEFTVSVPQSYRSKVCGICGNMNLDEQDDLTTRQFLSAKSDTEFVNSWKVDGYKHCASNPMASRPQKIKGAKKARVEMCLAKSYTEQRAARSRCGVLGKQEFRACYNSVDPKPYYTMCLEDVCTCSGNDACYCETLTAYVRECRRNGIVIRNWRTENMCALQCPQGMVYDDCAPACPLTCAGGELADPVCQNKPCVPSCRCPDGEVIQEGACIRRSMCT